MFVPKRLVIGLLTASLFSQLTACGTILYPERRGQIDGRLEPAIVVLDAVGLLFYLGPGLLAFGVDFATGAIYLPHGRYAVAPELLEPAIKANGQVDNAKLQQILQESLGVDLPLNHPNLRTHTGSVEQLAQYGLVPSA